MLCILKNNHSHVFLWFYDENVLTQSRAALLNNNSRRAGEAVQARGLEMDKENKKQIIFLLPICLRCLRLY